MRTLIVVNYPKDWNFGIDDVEIVAAKNYLTDPKYAEIKNARVFNLCRSYRYQATGYYVSLLAEARGHRVFPNVSTMQDLKSQTIVRIISDDLDELIQKSLKNIKSQNFTLSIYFGQNTAKQYDHLAAQLYNLFQAPLIRAQFTFTKRWNLMNISPVPVNEIPENHREFVEQFAKSYFTKKRIYTAKLPMAMYDLAILLNNEEKEPPSNKKAITNFMDAAESIGLRTELITRDDFSRIPEFDALFIRETTNVNHHTYRFSRRAFTEGLVVIDDPKSILQCANKVFLAELLNRAKIATPRTIIVHKDTRETVEGTIGFPCVLKQPDSSFSKGVVKVENRESLTKEIDRMMESSDLIIAQEFLYSDFDWRIGILDREPIFACKYYMAKDHWQIYNWKGKGDDKYGMFDAVPVYEIPKNILKTALKAANLIGDGLYGVDVKEINKNALIIEINDNPSIDAGIEDSIMREHLYLSIMKSFKERIENLRRVREISL